MAAPFEFSEIQAQHILDMTLSRLTRLGRSNLEEELTQLRETITGLEAILADPERLRGVIKTEMGEIRNDFATPRRAESELRQMIVAASIVAMATRMIATSIAMPR